MEKTTQRKTVLSCLKECRKVLHELMGPEVNNEIIDFDELATNKDANLSEDDIATIKAIKAVEKELNAKKAAAKKSLREQLTKHEMSGGSQKQYKMIEQERETPSLCASPMGRGELGHSIPVKDYERE